MDMMQPGQVVNPQGPDEPQQPKEPKLPSPGAPEPDRPMEEPDDKPQPAPNPSPTPEPIMTIPNEDPELEMHADGVSWTASEFIAHEKGVSWYALVVAGGVVAAGLVYWLTRDVVSTTVILFAAIAFTAISARRPRTQQYSLTHDGLQIGSKVYYFHDFKNFSIAEEGAIASIVFMPLKRFMPPLTIYVAPDMEDQVFDFLSTVLPFEQHRSDAVDGLMRRLRF